MRPVRPLSIDSVLRTAVLALIAGCGGPEPAAPPAKPAAAECTGSTPLKPGVPGSPGQRIPSEYNPAGASELAHRMRVMLDDIQKTREAILAGTPVSPLPVESYERIRCSWPTSPSDRTPVFDTMAQYYLAQVGAFNKAPSAETYPLVVEACVACHKQSCQGPLVIIEPLRLP